MPKIIDEPTSFFTFCQHDFATKLSIPKSFAKEHRKFLLQKNVRLKTAESTRFWKVKIKKNNNGDFHIAGGWSDFVNDNDVLETHSLVLRIVSASIIHVTIFRDDACFHHGLPSPTPRDVEICHDDKIRDGDSCPRFVKELKDYHFDSKRLELPLRFAVSTGIGENKHATLKDSRGTLWPVKITDRNAKMYSITSGWIQFLKGNDLQPGSILLFEFVPDSDYVVNAVVMSIEDGKNLLGQAQIGGVLI